MERNRWYKDKVFYQVWCRSFRDGNGDGSFSMEGPVGVNIQNTDLMAFAIDGKTLAFSTDGGRLSLAHGFIKLLPDPVPGTDRIRYLTYYRSSTAQYPVVIAGSTVYAYKDMSWQSLYTIPGSLSGAEFDSVMAQIE